MDQSAIDPRLTTLEILFVVLRQLPIAAKPAQGPLHDPPPLVDLEDRRTGPLAHSFQDPTTVTLDPVQQGRPPIGRVGPHLRQTRPEPRAEASQEPLPAADGEGVSPEVAGQPASAGVRAALAGGECLLAAQAVAGLGAARQVRMHRMSANVTCAY